MAGPGVGQSKGEIMKIIEIKSGSELKGDWFLASNRPPMDTDDQTFYYLPPLYYLPLTVTAARIYRQENAKKVSNDTETD